MSREGRREVVIPLRRRSPAVWGLRIGLGLAATAALVYLAARQAEPQAAWRVLRAADPLPLAGALGAMLANIALKVWRWRWLFHPEAPRRLLAPLLVGQLGNVLLPGRMGDAARVWLAGRGGAGLGRSALTVLVEKAVDGLLLLGLAAGLVAFLPAAPELSAGRLAASGALGALFLVATLAAVWAPLRRRVLGLARLLGLAAHLEPPLAALGRPGVQLRLWGASLAIWLLAGLVNDLGFRAVGIDLPLTGGMLLAVTEIAGNNLAYSPAGVGVYHSICVVTLSLFGVGYERALSAAVLLHLVVYGPIVVGGLGSLWLAGRGPRPWRMWYNDE